MTMMKSSNAFGFQFHHQYNEGLDFIISEVSPIVKFYGFRQSLSMIMKSAGVMTSVLNS